MKAWCGLRHPQNVNRKIYDIIQMLLLLWTLIGAPPPPSLNYDKQKNPSLHL